MAVDEIVYQPLMVVMVGLIVLLAVVSHVMLVMLSPRQAASYDERDRQIARWGEQVGGRVASAGAVAVVAPAIFEIHRFWIAHVLPGPSFLGEFAEATVKLALYRRGV